MKKNSVKVTIAALAIGVLAMCTGMTGYAVQDQDATGTSVVEQRSTIADGTYKYGTYTGWDKIEILMNGASAQDLNGPVQRKMDINIVSGVFL